jgi:GTPase Era involved in 16S rRNA processing
MSGHLARAGVVARITRLCDELDGVLDDDLRATVTAARTALSEPLRLAVVGRVSAGKSTLVNALVGRRVAPTSAGECTRVVTWYRYGTPDRAEIRLRDGSVRPLRLLNRALPDELGFPASKIDAVTVRLQAGALRDLVLIDTPGLGSLTAESETATRRAVVGTGEASQRAAGEADALLFIISDAARKRDIDFMADFHAACGRSAATAPNVVGVVSQADRFGSGPFDTSDPFRTARAIAAGLGKTHAAEISEVVAVSGLLAESARTGRVTESFAQRLAELAPLDPVALALRQQDPALNDLFQVLGPYAVLAGRERAMSGAAGLRAWCEEVSAVSDLEASVRHRLVPHAALLKSSRALGVLAAAARTTSRRERALALVEETRLDPALHPLEELRAAQLLKVHAPASELTDQLRALLEDEDPAAHLGEDPLKAARQHAADATRHAALTLEPAEADAARVLARSYQLLARRLVAGDAAVNVEEGDPS